MKEYCIYNIWNGGKPFISNTFNSFTEAKNFLLECVELEKERGRPYFVENEFYKNEYVRGVRGKYFSIKVREISSWIVCNGENEVNEIKRNKIVKIY